MPSLSLSLELGSNYVSGSSVTAMPTDSISLWLMADAGVVTTTYPYKSNIALSGAGQTTINGNYTPASIPQINQNYTIAGPNNNRIEVRPNSSPVYRLYNTDNYVNGGPTYYDFTSTNGTAWSLGNGKRPVSITISGLTGVSATANRTYNLFEGSVDNTTIWLSYSSNYENDGVGGILKVYQDGTCELFSITVSGGNQVVEKVADGSNWGIGSFTLVSPGTGSPVGSGTIYPTGGVPTGVVTTSNANTDNVTSWVDQSSNGFNATGINNPILEADQINSKPVIKLSSFEDDGNDGYYVVDRAFNLGNNASIMGATGTTAFAVTNVDNVCNNSDANGPIFGNFGSSASQSNYPLGTDCSVYDAFASTTRKGPLTSPVTIPSSWTLYSVVSTSNDWRAYVNGQLMHSTATNTYNNSVSGASLYIGYHNAGGDFYLKGKIAEIVIYSRVLTTLERVAVQTYLNTKYALYA